MTIIRLCLLCSILVGCVADVTAPAPQSSCSARCTAERDACGSDFASCEITCEREKRLPMLLGCGEAFAELQGCRLEYATLCDSGLADDACAESHAELRTCVDDACRNDTSALGCDDRCVELCRSASSCGSIAHCGEVCGEALFRAEQDGCGAEAWDLAMCRLLDRPAAYCIAETCDSAWAALDDCLEPEPAVLPPATLPPMTACGRRCAARRASCGGSTDDTCEVSCDASQALFEEMGCGEERRRWEVCSLDSPCDSGNCLTPLLTMLDCRDAQCGQDPTAPACRGYCSWLCASAPSAGLECDVLCDAAMESGHAEGCGAEAWERAMCRVFVEPGDASECERFEGSLAACLSVDS